MSTRTERDRARIRCLIAAISSLHCEVARVVQQGEEPEKLEEYAHANLAMGEVGNDLVGLDMGDLVDLLGSIAAMEKLVAMGQPLESIRALMQRGSVDHEMWNDLLLYLEAITQDRPMETSDVMA
jgi:hypothetical protein